MAHDISTAPTARKLLELQQLNLLEHHYSSNLSFTNRWRQLPP